MPVQVAAVAELRAAPADARAALDEQQRQVALLSFFAPLNPENLQMTSVRVCSRQRALLLSSGLDIGMVNMAV